MTKRLSRRQILALGAAIPAVGLPTAGLALETSPRHLDFDHLHTGEKLRDVVYFEGGRYVPDALAAVNHHLRDFRTGDAWPIDINLLDQLHELRRMTGSMAAYEIISGYRSPATNDMLRRRGGGVAKRSLHMKGQAVDIRIAGISTATLRDSALSLGRGGVGFYPKSGFVHLDTGRFRTW